MPRTNDWNAALGCVLLSLCASLCASGCATERNSQHAVDLREQLRAAMQTSVTSREQRDEQSRLMRKVVEEDAVDGMTRPEVRAAFGPGLACTLDVCHKNGFEETDWYYPIGVNESDKVQQLPLLLFKFDPHERTVRVFTLTTD
ncbi:MAG TPA: hypothetical protein VGI70_00290 [Polyangiales bacterium]